jgi:hypothetical protein
MGVRLQEREGKGWYVIIHWKGQRRTKFFGKNKALAKEFRDKLDAKLKLGGAGLPNKVTLQAYAVGWLERIRHTRKRSTHQDHAQRMNQDILPALATIDLQNVDPRTDQVFCPCMSQERAGA